MEKISYLGLSLTRWKVGNSTFLALPEKGARLMNWNIALGDGSVRDVVYWPELASSENIHLVRGGNPILFPFNARTFDRGDIHFWRDAAGIRRPMPMHGIARQSEFDVTRLDANGFEAVLRPGEEAKACYPFDYEFKVSYRFAPLGLACEFALTNRGTQPLPWSAGHHFYFTVPWSDDAKRSDYLIRVPGTRRLRQDFATGRLVPGPDLRPEERMDNPELPETIHTALRSPQVVFGEKGRPGDVTVRIGTAKVPPPDAAFVTWTQGLDSPYYCIEPWMGPPNAPETKEGLHFVPPGSTETFTVEVAVG